MTIYKVTHGASVVEFTEEALAIDYANMYSLSAPTSEEREIASDSLSVIIDALQQKQEVAKNLLREIYANNVLSGITTEQSDALFTDYADVILRVKEGAFPTALLCLQQKSPAGFVTQEILDTWIDIIQRYV